MVRLRFIRPRLVGLAAIPFAVLLVTACGDGGNGEGGQTEEPPGRIAFATDRDGDAEIYIMNADGSQPVNITSSSESQDFEPAWSPDGASLAFSSLANGTSDIYVISAAGRDRQQLTEHDAVESTPRWSPAGSLSSFYSARSQSEGSLWLVNPDGSDARVVPLAQDLADPQTPCRAVTPFSWLPDGQRLIFQGSRAETNAVEVCAVNIDGSEIEVIRSDEGAMNIAPAASPDGRRIAFASNRNDGDFEIYVMDLDGDGLPRLTVAAGAGAAVVAVAVAAAVILGVARGLRRLALTLGVGLAVAAAVAAPVFVVVGDGGDPRRLTDAPGRDDQPTWSPDGQWIAFTSTRDAGFEIYVMRADGSDLRRLTDNEAIDGDPAWSPR